MSQVDWKKLTPAERKEFIKAMNVAPVPVRKKQRKKPKDGQGGG